MVGDCGTRVTEPRRTVRSAAVLDAQVRCVRDSRLHAQAIVSTSGTSSFDAGWEEELAPRNDGTEFFIAELAGVAIGVGSSLSQPESH